MEGLSRKTTTAVPLVEMGWVMVLRLDIVDAVGGAGGLVIGKAEMRTLRTGGLFLSIVVRKIVSLGAGRIIPRRWSTSRITIHVELEGDMLLMDNKKGHGTTKWIMVLETDAFPVADIHGLLGTTLRDFIFY